MDTVLLPCNCALLFFCTVLYSTHLYQWSDNVVKSFVRSDWKVRNGTVNRTVNMIVTPHVQVNILQCCCQQTFAFACVFAYSCCMNQLATVRCRILKEAGPLYSQICVHCIKGRSQAAFQLFNAWRCWTGGPGSQWYCSNALGEKSVWGEISVTLSNANCKVCDEHTFV